MNVQETISPSVRMRFELPQSVPSELPAWPPELPRAGVELHPPQRERQRKLYAKTIPALSARARSVLVRCLSTRAQQATAKSQRTDQQLLRIAMRCSRADLMAQHGVGPGTIDEIEAWLKAQGKELRQGPPSLSAALDQALGHIEAMLDGANPDAFLAAFVALPELRWSLDTQTARR